MSNLIATAATPRTPFATRYGRYSDLILALQVSRVTIWRWTQEPDFPKPIKRGNTVLFDIEAVEAWLNGEVA